MVHVGTDQPANITANITAKQQNSNNICSESAFFVLRDAKTT